MMKTHILLRPALFAALLSGPSVAAAQQAEPVRLLGEVRTRAELDRPTGTDSVDGFALLRSRIGVEAALSSRAVVMLQVQDARVFGEEVSTTHGAADRLDMHQAWLQYRFDAGRQSVSVRAGRQAIILGNERLVGASGWTNTGRAFDGARVSVGPRASEWRVHGLAATIHERGRRATGEQPDRPDHLFAGMYFESPAVDFFALHDREAAYRIYTGVDRTTLGTRVGRQWGAVLPSLEAAYQVGNQLRDPPVPEGVQDRSTPVPQDIRAWMLGARLGYDTQLRALPRVGIGVDVLSGDGSPGDATFRAFHTLYATNHRYYGYLDVFTDPAARTAERGLIDGIATVRVGVTRRVALDVDVHGFWLEQEYVAATSRHIGWEVDFTVPVSLGTGQQLQLGYSVFRNGAAAPLIGIGRERDLRHWAYVQATFSFGGLATPIL